MEEEYKQRQDTDIVSSTYDCYTDGAYSPLTETMGIGIIALKDGKPIIEYSRSFKGGTNNRAELIAIITALRLVKKPIKRMRIFTDSEYCIGCATLGWKRKKNILLWAFFDREIERVESLCPNLSFQHVKGHSDNKWNNKCDRLARNATQHEV